MNNKIIISLVVVAALAGGIYIIMQPQKNAAPEKVSQLMFPQLLRQQQQRRPYQHRQQRLRQSQLQQPLLQYLKLL